LDQIKEINEELKESSKNDKNKIQELLVIWLIKTFTNDQSYNIENLNKVLL